MSVCVCVNIVTCRQRDGHQNMDIYAVKKEAKRKSDEDVDTQEQQAEVRSRRSF